MVAKKKPLGSLLKINFDGSFDPLNELEVIGHIVCDWEERLFFAEAQQHLAASVIETEAKAAFERLKNVHKIYLAIGLCWRAIMWSLLTKFL